MITPPNNLYLIRLPWTRCETGIIGKLFHADRFLCYTLEHHNTSGISNTALTRGVYELDWTFSPKFHTFLPLVIAKGRDGIRIHAGNTEHDTKGCILTGMSYDSLNGLYLHDSRQALNIVLQLFERGLPPLKLYISYLYD